MHPLCIRKASLHNLKNIDLTFPKNKLVVVTGVSGSGKSTLVFDILFDASRKSYLRAIGALADLGEDLGLGFETITGLRPAVAVRQGVTRQSNPRSVVGTRTKLLHYLGTLYADDYNRQRSGFDDAMTAAHFSFNSPLGMCLGCEGRGFTLALNFDVLLPDKTTTLPQLYRNTGLQSRFQNRLKRLPERYGFDLATPFIELPDAVRQLVLYGRAPDGSQKTGLDAHLRHALSRGKPINNAMTAQPCPDCAGYRVSSEARAVRIGGRHIGQLGQMTIREIDRFLPSMRQGCSKVGQLLLKQITEIVTQLIAVRLDYLSPYRPLPTLSGGEAQRLFLMSCLHSSTDSLLYIFDEPTAGLHELEKQQLLTQLLALRAQGNALIVVEHDSRSIQAAEHVIDIGPLAGQHGGEVVYQGSYKGLLRCKASLTGQYLSGRKQLPLKAAYRAVKRTTPCLVLHGVKTNNLKSLSVHIPLGVMVGVAGVSGSGKSSLIADTLVPALQHRLRSADTIDSSNDESPSVDLSKPAPALKSLTGIEHIGRCVEVSQAPIGRRSNSNPATYLGLWDRIRRHFAAAPLAKTRGYGAGHFSFNAQGACEHCRGTGQHRLWLGSTHVSYRCDSCKGLRYHSEILDVRHGGHTITDVLDMSAAEALTLFADDGIIRRMLSVLARTGMGYITLGQPTSTLSGGEAQRIKLAKEIGRINPRNQRPTLFILDEPTTGLSLHDVAQLLGLLDELVEQGNSVLVVEHDPKVLSHCDWLLELGPSGGDQGGKLIAKGSPLALYNNTQSLIGPFLTPVT